MSEEHDQIVSFSEDYAKKLVENLGHTVTKVVPVKANIGGASVWVYVVHTKSENTEDDSTNSAAYIVSSVTGIHYEPAFFWQHVANPRLQQKTYEEEPKNTGRNLLYYPPSEEG